MVKRDTISRVVEPVRRCAGCGLKVGKSKLIRIIRLVDDLVIFDPEQKQEGRSLYFCPSGKCFDTLMRRKAPEKLMKIALPDQVREAIKRYLSPMESERDDIT